MCEDNLVFVDRVNFVGDKATLSNALSDEKPTANFDAYKGVQPSFLENLVNDRTKKNRLCKQKIIFSHKLSSWFFIKGWECKDQLNNKRLVMLVIWHTAWSNSLDAIHGDV